MSENVIPIDTAKPRQQNAADAVAQHITICALEAMARIDRKHETMLEQMADGETNQHRANEFRALAFNKRINASTCENLACRLKQDNGR